MKNKILKIKEHLEEHPHDYQAVVSLYKATSNEIEWEIEQKKHEKRKKIAECRRLLNEREQQTK